MAHTENWIWLDPDKYPSKQRTLYSALAGSGVGTSEDGSYCAAEFRRAYEFDADVVSAELRVSGDTEFRLDVNGITVMTGPMNVGGDFLFNGVPRSKHYASVMTIAPGSARLEFFARVKLMPVAINDYSRGHGGFMLSARLTLKNGRVKFICTDSTWQARANGAYCRPYCYSQALDTDAFSPAVPVDNIWHCETAPTKVRTEEIIYPLGDREFILAPGEKKDL